MSIIEVEIDNGEGEDGSVMTNRCRRIVVDKSGKCVVCEPNCFITTPEGLAFFILQGGRTK